MAKRVYLRSTKVPGKKYEVVGFDKESKVVKLKNKDGTIFEHPNFSKESALRDGYELETESEAA